MSLRTKFAPLKDHASFKKKEEKIKKKSTTKDNGKNMKNSWKKNNA